MANILVVEDDKFLGREIGMALEGGGHEVFWIKNSDEVSEALESQSFDLIFLDIMLPGNKDGYALLAEMKNSEKYKNVPVVMLSNLGQMSEIDKAMEMGAMDYVVKSNIDLDNLVELTSKKFLHNG